jgi:hypothetical protein
LPAPWVPLSHTIMGPDATCSALRATGTDTVELRSLEALAPCRHLSLATAI